MGRNSYFLGIFIAFIPKNTRFFSKINGLIPNTTETFHVEHLINLWRVNDLEILLLKFAGHLLDISGHENLVK